MQRDQEQKDKEENKHGAILIFCGRKKAEAKNGKSGSDFQDASQPNEMTAFWQSKNETVAAMRKIYKRVPRNHRINENKIYKFWVFIFDNEPSTYTLAQSGGRLFSNKAARSYVKTEKIKR